MSLEVQIIVAFMLDQLIGDPRSLPHPVKFIGSFALWCEGKCRHVIANQKAAGIASVVAVLCTTGGIVSMVIYLAGFAGWLQDAVEIYFLFSAIAARDLAWHSRKVYKALQEEDIEKARRKVAMIVGRDTAALDEQGVGRACVESVAENLVDGVTAPLFWAIIGGPVGAVLYKAINTMDSTFGYKNEKYLQFGWAAARLDDLVNYLPARITAFIMMAVAPLLRLSVRQAYRVWLRDRYNHASPNSGHTEAAAAGALGIQLGGSSYYFGKLLHKPTIGDADEKVQPAHILRANNLMLTASLLALVLFLGARIIILQ